MLDIQLQSLRDGLHSPDHHSPHRPTRLTGRSRSPSSRGIVWAATLVLVCLALPGLAFGAGSEMFSTVSGSTGEKPQSKLFYHDGYYWAVLQGPDGVAFYQLVGGTWQRGQFPNAVLQSSGNADVKWNGTELYVLVYASTPRLYQYSYNGTNRSWVLASGFPVTVPNPSGSETMVLEQDSSGRLWVTAEGGGNVNVYYTTSADHRTWSSTPIVLRTGLNSDDITSIVAFGGNKVGVFWSDQNRDEFGFRVHLDTDPVATWGPVEIADSGSGHADDHVNLAFDSQDRVYAITKDASDHMRVHRRATNGAWTTKTDVIGGSGTRGIIMVAEQDSKVYILYTRWGVSPERIEYRVADIEALSFGGETIFISSTKDMNNVTGMKQILPQGSLIAVAENGSKALWNDFGSPPSGGPQPPSPPQNLTATLHSSPTRVDLSWAQPSSGSVGGYNVYRQADGGSFQKLNSGLLTGLTFTDSSPPEAALCYQVTAMGTNGLESAPSSLACVDTRPGPPPGTIETRIAASADDAEEHSDETVKLDSSDLEMMNDGTPQLRVGLRFPGLAIPAGATITKAYVQFEADESQSDATSLTIQGEATDDAPAFSSASGSLTVRPTTQAAVTWPNLVPWTSGQVGTDQRTPDLTPVLQEVVGRGGWQSGNALALMITGSGHRTAVAYDGIPGSAPLLHVEFATGPVANRAPSVNAGPSQVITLPSDAVLDGTVTDDGLPSPPSLTTTWSRVSGPGSVTFLDPSATDTRASFTVAGAYVLELKANDGALEARDTMTVVVQDASSGATIETRIAAGADDAEEHSDGTVNLTSDDLELMKDGTPQLAVGLRFPGLAIPVGASITRAYVQFVADENRSHSTSLTIRGQAVGDAPAFAATSGNLTGRQTTQAAVDWPNLAAWSVGQAGPDQRTPDLSPVLQEIVGSSGWQSGNALALLITGSGHRTAVSYEGIPGSAPLLHVEFATGTVLSRAVASSARAIAPALLLGARVAPNPMRSDGTLHYSLPEAGPVRIELFDVQGRRVLTLVDLPSVPAGSHEVGLNGSGEAGASLQAGLYFYRLQVPGRAISGRFVVVR
ncbi:MAG TPA: T9SS type A sorting domain-containing protein [Candidatus Eisenbacteria bacterium]|jgi:hypothetical protein